MGELGDRLRSTRDERGLTLEDAERDTRISKRYLQALESYQLPLIPKSFQSLILHNLNP